MSFEKEELLRWLLTYEKRISLVWWVMESFEQFLSCLMLIKWKETPFLCNLRKKNLFMDMPSHRRGRNCICCLMESFSAVFKLFDLYRKEGIWWLKGRNLRMKNLIVGIPSQGLYVGRKITLVWCVMDKFWAVF